MTQRLWAIITNAIHSIKNVPDWVVSQANLSFEDILRLPALDATVKGEDAIPSVEEKLVSPSYIGFLREQINTESRGPESRDVLIKRLVTLEPFVNKKIITAIFFKRPHLATLRIDPETKAVIQLELD